MTIFEKSLGNNLILRNIRKEQDIEKYVKFRTDTAGVLFTFRPGLGSACNKRIRHHPESPYEYSLIVEDKLKDVIVAAVCLIPWHFKYGEVPLNVAMLEEMWVLPQYRSYGLSRALINQYHQIVNNKGFDLSIIIGIPYYYRKYGYTYAIDYRPCYSLPLRYIPEKPKYKEHHYKFRKARITDIKILTDLYQESVSNLDFYDNRDENFWHYLIKWFKAPVKIIEDNNNSDIVGYIWVEKLSENRGAKVFENAIKSNDVCMETLQYLKKEINKRNGDILINGPSNNILVQVAKSLGSISLKEFQISNLYRPIFYQWLLRITDITKFLLKIKPVLEQRIENSDFVKLSTDVYINIYKEAFLLRFKDGKIIKVESLGFKDSSVGSDGGDICIPLEAFTRLIFGYRNIEQLSDAWPDIMVKFTSIRLINILFPKIKSFLYLPFQ